MPCCKRPGNRQIALGRHRGGVVFEPGQPPRAVHPESAQESNLAHGGANVARQPRPRGQHQQHRAGRRAEIGGNEHHRARIGQAEDRPAQRQPPGRAPARRSHGPVPALPCRPAVVDQALANAGDAHLLARRRGGGDGEQMARQPTALRSPLLGRSLDCRPPGRGQHRGDGEHGQTAGARDEWTPAAPWSRPGAGSTPGWKTATCTCGRARTPGCAAWTGGRDTPGAPGGPPSPPWPAAGRHATSSAMVTLSRKRRCTRVLMVRRNQVAAVETPRPTAAISIQAVRCWSTPLPSSHNHNASSASGSAASCDRAKDTIISRGSWR